MPPDELSPYKSVAPIARYFKSIVQMLIGLTAAAFAIREAWIGLAEDLPITRVQDHVFEAIALGLAVAAAVELAYTLFTPGPDEALDPLMLALSAALILQLGKVEDFHWQEAISALTFAAALAGLFVIRKYLATQHEPANWSPMEAIRRRPLSSKEGADRTDPIS